jgi:hypothetical protein
MKTTPELSAPRDNLHRALLALACCALAIFVAVAVAWHPDATSPMGGIHHVILQLSDSASMGLFIAVLIERHFRQRERRELVQTGAEIAKSTTAEIKRDLKESIAIVGSAHDFGLSEILPPRQHRKGERTHAAFSDALVHANCASIVVVSGRRLFSPGMPGHRGFFENVVEVREQAGNHDCLNVRALMIDPDSDAARRRENLEHRMKIKADVALTIDGIEELNASLGGALHIEYGTYDSDPQLWAVITEQWAFVEWYHSADAEELHRAIGCHSDTSWCAGGRVPVMRFVRDCDSFKSSIGHFESLWKIAQRTRIKKSATDVRPT